MKLIQIGPTTLLAVTMAFAQRPGNDATVGATDANNHVSPTKSADTDLRTGESRTGADKSQSGTSDQQFVERAAEGGHAEIALAHMAMTKSSNSKVKSYAQMMIRDHGKTNKELLSLAKKSGITLQDYSADTTERREKTGSQALNRGGDLSHPHPDEGSSQLAAASGTEFDRLYMERQVDDHKKAIELFEHESENGMQADLKQFAMRTLPTLRAHLTQAEMLKDAK